MKFLTPALILLVVPFMAHSQMYFESDSLYGNEWVDHDLSYLKFELNFDDVYTIKYTDMLANGAPENIKGSDLQLFSFGKQVPIYVSTNSEFSEEDFIIFYGQKNKGELDQTLYQDWENEQSNLSYSMFSDLRAYFLTWKENSNNNSRITKITNDLSGNLPPKENFYMYEEKQVFSEYHLDPIINTENLSHSHFEKAEGFGSKMENLNKVNIDCTEIYDGSPFANLSVRFVSNPFIHDFRTFFNGEFIESLVFNGYNVVQLEYELSTSDLAFSNEFKINSQDDKSKSSLTELCLTYPRNFEAGDQNFFQASFPRHSFNKYFEINSFATNGDTPIVIDPENGVLLEATIENGVVKFVLPSADNDRNILIFEEAKSITQFEEIQFVNFDLLSPEYVILTSKELDGEDETGVNWIEEYKLLRSSVMGGSYNVEVVHIEQIYNQFGYGIANHSIGVKNWSNYYSERWNNWDLTFLIGKAHEYNKVRTDLELVSHVPTWGIPGSDNYSFSKGRNTFPEMGIGRLAVSSKEQIGIYLDKQISYLEKSQLPQTIEERYWTKNIIHLSGGDAQIQETIRKSLDEMKDTITNSHFGADVITFQKTSTNNIQSSLSKRILEQIRNGSSIITFFGHSAVNVFDFSIEDPSKFDNIGKTPIIISLGCHSGNVHTTAFGISERFVLEPEEGSIAFFASSGPAFIPPQRDHGIHLYDLIGNEMYGQELGLIIQKLLIDKRDPNNNQDVTTLQEQLTFHGDPAIKLPASPTPDYTPDFKSFRTDPEVVSGRLDSFDLCFDIVNLGRHTEEELSYYLVHRHGQKQDTFYYTTPAVFNTKNVCHSLPINVTNYVGENFIEVYLDYQNEIPEAPAPQAEQNNSINDSYQIPGYSFFVLNDNPIPFYPREFAITNDDQLTLQASTGNGLVASRKYTIEIDTTELFDSPFKQSNIVEANGGLVKWKPEINYTNNQVYYWRTRVENSSFDVSFWNESSFIHLDQYENGWNQGHFFQLLKNEFDDLEIDSMSRQYQFSESTYEFDVYNVRRDLDNFSQFSVNSSFLEGHYFVDFQGGVFIALIDPNSLQLITCPEGGALGADNELEGRERNLWPFETATEEGRQELTDFLTDEQIDDHYIIMFTVQSEFQDYKPEEWSEELFSVFENEGAMRIRELIGNPRPYIFAYQIGQGFISESIANAPDEVLTSTITLLGTWFEGRTHSSLIGPAKSWNKLIWNFEELNLAEDDFEFNLIGKKLNGLEDTLAFNITDQEFDLSFINVEEYPFLKLSTYFEDTISLSSPGIDFWRVLYEPLPDAVFNATEDFVFHADTIQRGDDIYLKYQIDNISESDLDSVLVHYTLIDKQNNQVQQTKRKSPLEGKNSIQDEFTQNTTDMGGQYQLRVEINPDMDQAEEFDFNNVGVVNFLVKIDDINPLLDVTFDGIRILDGDIISPKPLIKISLTDENSQLLLDNPEDFILVLEYPDESREEIEIDNPAVTFYPAEANSETNMACIEFTPELAEGEYIFYVQAKDATGNFSGDHHFQISFEVYENDEISNVINYPNPFSTSTEFVFTLTGNKIPNDYHIKIMTLSGKVVREIRRDEIGPIRVGVNRSEYKWDGRDEFGSKLANGVYLYKFYTDLENELEDFEVKGIDSMYKNGYGKLVIMR